MVNKRFFSNTFISHAETSIGRNSNLIHASVDANGQRLPFKQRPHQNWQLPQVCSIIEIFLANGFVYLNETLKLAEPHDFA